MCSSDLVRDRLRGLDRMASLAVVLEHAGRQYTAADRLALAERKNRTYRASLESLTPDDLLPGVERLLAELRRAGVKLAVASSSRNARLILDRLAVTPAFDAVIDGDDIRQAKPHPEIFLVAAAALGCLPGECVVLEDAAAGVEAARRARMAVWGIGTPESLPGVQPLTAGLADVHADGLLRLAGGGNR